MEGESFKRRGPKKLEPFVFNGVRYTEDRDARARGLQQPGGVLLALDEKTNQELWSVLVYETIYTNEETDVQDTYITQITLSEDGQSLLITNERKQRFAVHLQSRVVTALP